MRKIINATFVIGMALMLAACSGEPSEKALRSAVEKDFEKTGQAFGGKLSIKLHEMKKIACRESKEAPGYVCDVQIDADFPILGRSSRNLTVRAVKSDGEWTVVKASD